MSNPTGPDQPDEAAEAAAEAIDETDETQKAEAVDRPGARARYRDLVVAGGRSAAARRRDEPARGAPLHRAVRFRRGLDPGRSTRPAEPATEVMSVPDAPAGVAAATAFTEPMAHQKPVAPQVIPPRTDPGKPPRTRRSWGWVVAVLLVIAALVAVAILGTLLLTRGSTPKVSQEDMVRSTIQNFDVAIQKGDLATLRSITCGTTRDSYVNYEERAWTETHARVAAAKQYPVVASIDQVVVNGDHAEANVTTFMAYAPQTRSTRSFDLQFRDDQWKICQAPDG